MPRRVSNSMCMRLALITDEAEPWNRTRVIIYVSATVFTHRSIDVYWMTFYSFWGLNPLRMRCSKLLSHLRSDMPFDRQVLHDMFFILENFRMFHLFPKYWADYTQKTGKEPLGRPTTQQ